MHLQSNPKFYSCSSGLVKLLIHSSSIPALSYVGSQDLIDLDKNHLSMSHSCHNDKAFYILMVSVILGSFE